MAQDLTSYGRDLGGPGLAELLAALSNIEGVQWLRPLYLHPDLIDDHLIAAILANPKVAPYFDLPLQHVADPVLLAMGRKRSGSELKALVRGIRQSAPQAVLRTTLLVGHPGEGEAEFAALKEFVAEMEFDRLGVFPYSPEAGTRSARLPAPPARVAGKRAAQIMDLQQRISRRRLAPLLDQTLPVLGVGPPPGQRPGMGRAHPGPGPGGGRPGDHHRRLGPARRHRPLPHQRHPRLRPGRGSGLNTPIIDSRSRKP